jgi:hypothetical protein
MRNQFGEGRVSVTMPEGMSFLAQVPGLTYFAPLRPCWLALN